MKLKLNDLIPNPEQPRSEIDLVEQLVLGLIGNLQRQDMNVIERARCYKRLTELGMTYREIGKISNMAESMVGTNIKLLSLPVEIQELYAAGEIPFDVRLIKIWGELDNDQAIRLANQAKIRRMTTKRILWMASRLSHAGFEPEKKLPIWIAKVEFGHWNALAMLKLQGHAVTDARIKTAAIETCQACALYEGASRNVCRDCPAVELIRRLA